MGMKVGGHESLSIGSLKLKLVDGSGRHAGDAAFLCGLGGTLNGNGC
jgi:hypothetical protein